MQKMQKLIDLLPNEENSRELQRVARNIVCDLTHEAFSSDLEDDLREFLTSVELANILEIADRVKKAQSVSSISQQIKLLGFK